ncbi:hypothetical protein F5B22DRAFT_652607 [Xylaria bambusicola]|uniref:uncharacterized protein n=1 Tax=Xylaria bambusicola TaxID=326684 RepID=UPI0020088DA2|nr:uncharacterized protein F5B22DRAFT_652607 [Xylaria bambusicola]KAI0502915.1 hypothetical protein F5B22DRAFT_652607 [Xylaria bambusicola]
MYPSHTHKPAEGSASPVVRVQLSWPKLYDNRRAIVTKSSPGCGKDSNSLPSLSVPLPWKPHDLEIREMDLLQYFEHKGCQALTTFGYGGSRELGRVLLRMALTDDSPSATVLLRLVLAFASLHLHGIQIYALEQKTVALSMLASNCQDKDLDVDETIWHVVSGIMLYSCEVLRPSSTSGDWVKYISGVKEVIKAAQLEIFCQDTQDVRSLLDWVYYNDAMAHFSLRHCASEGASIPSPSTIMWNIAPLTPSPATKLLGLLIEICDTVLEDMIADTSDNFKQFVKILDWKIKMLPTLNPMEEAFHIAALIYLGRASGTLLKEPLKTQERLDRAFELLPELASCERQFPIFILGCEARTDKRRVIVLDLIYRTMNSPASRSFDHIRLLLEAIWAQDDLEDNRLHKETNYWKKINLTMARCAIIPSFA